MPPFFLHSLTFYFLQRATALFFLAFIFFPPSSLELCIPSHRISLTQQQIPAFPKATFIGRIHSIYAPSLFVVSIFFSKESLDHGAI